MSAQNGKDMLIKLDLTGDGLFETLAGLRATRLSFNAETVDVTSLESEDGWREILAGAGVKTAHVSGAGVFKDAGSDARARQVFFAGETPEFQVILPDLGTIEGAFHLTALDYAGTYDGEVTYEMSLNSAGPISFTAVAI